MLCYVKWGPVIWPQIAPANSWIKKRFKIADFRQFKHIFIDGTCCVSIYNLDQNDRIFLEFVVFCCSLMSHASYSTKLMKKPTFCEILATYSLKTYHANPSPWLWISSYFGMLSTTKASLCLVFWLEMSKPLHISYCWKRKWSQML